MIKLPVLLFDSECPLCVRFTQALRLVDKEEKICFVSIYDDDIYKMYPELNEKECEETIHFIKENKEIIKGSEVLEYLISEIPSVEKFAWLLESERSKQAVDAFYKKINEVRKIIKKKGCTGCGRASMRKNI